MVSADSPALRHILVGLDLAEGDGISGDGISGDGTVSVWCGSPDGAPDVTRTPGTSYYAASTMKVAVLAGAVTLAEVGRLDLDADVEVHDDFASVSSGRFTMDRDYDGDDLPWQRLGERVPLGWLARRMIVGSSNLATNLVLERVGVDAVGRTLAAAGVAGVVVRRGITDTAASDAGIQNTVTAAGLAALFGSIAAGRIVSRAGCATMLDILRAQEHLDAIPTGLPPGTVAASKGGWVQLLRHDVALIEPATAAPYVLAVCTEGMGDDAALALIRAIAAASWADRVAA